MVRSFCGEQASTTITSVCAKIVCATKSSKQPRRKRSLAYVETMAVTRGVAAFGAARLAVGEVRFNCGDRNAFCATCQSRSLRPANANVLTFAQDSVVLAGGKSNAIAPVFSHEMSLGKNS